MALIPNKFIIPEGTPSDTAQMMKSSPVGIEDLYAFGFEYKANSDPTYLDAMADVELTLTNDALGETTIHLPEGVNRIWDAPTYSFLFDELGEFVVVDIRASIAVNTESNNTEVTATFRGNYGTTEEYDIVVAQGLLTKTRKYIFTPYFSVFAGNDTDRLNPSRLMFVADKNCSVRLNSLFIKVARKGF